MPEMTSDQLLAAHDRSRVELAEFREELPRRSGS